MRNRWVSLMSGILIQSILGGIYAWSSFIPQLRNTGHLSTAQGSFIFGLSIAIFTLSMIFAGRFISVHGPRLTASIGAVLYIAGFLIASFSGGSFVLLLLGLGMVTGTGIGFGYVCPLTVGVKLFPEHKGLVTGVSVAGFGGGAILLSSVADYFLSSGFDIFRFFGFWGLSSGALMLLAAQFLYEPQTKKNSAISTVTRNAYFSLPFIVSCLGIFAGTFAGLLINGNLAPLVMALGLSEVMIPLAISLFAAGNALGRITWGFLFDRFGYKCIPLSLAGFAIMVLALMVIPALWIIPPIVCCFGFFFGANFVVYAASIARHFGDHVFSSLYPLCFLFYGFAGLVGPGLGGYLADLSGSYRMPLLVSVGILLAATLLSISVLSSFNRRKCAENQ